jgi:hypothetical protein
MISVYAGFNAPLKGRENGVPIVVTNPDERNGRTVEKMGEQAHQH